MNIKEIAMKHAREYLTFKLGGRKGCDIQEIVEDDEIYADIVSELAEQFEALVAELAKENKPVYYLWENKYGDPQQMLSSNSGPHPEYVITALYTLPPTAEQIEQETAEACAEWVRSGLHDDDPYIIARGLEDGAWKECK